MERIIKIAENNVEVQTICFEERVGGKERIVERQSYGQERIDKERLASETRKAELDTLDINAEKAKEDAKLAKLDLIQAERDKE